ncbi:hypothetical protein MKW92_047308, partial [Papaver armeniacum]
KIRNEPAAASIPHHTNELENSSSSSSSPSQGDKLTSANANSCLTSPIRESSKGCSDKEEEDTTVSRIATAKHNTCSPNGQLDCRGRKQVSDSEEVDNNNDGYSSPDAQFDVSQGYTAHCPAGDSVLLSPDILFGDSDRPSSQTDSEQLEKSQEIVCRDSDHPSSRDQIPQVIMNEERSSQAEEMHIPSSTELSNNHDNDMPEEEEEEKLGAKSFHAYDGSVSSYEGWDDQLHHQHIRKYTYEFDDSSGEQIRTDVPLNDKVNPRVPLPLRSRKFQTMSLNDHQAKTRMGSNVDSNQEPPADIGNGTNAQEMLLNSESFHTAQTSTQSQRMSEKDFYRKVLPANFENGGPSTSYSNKEFMYDSDSHPVEKALSVERNQDELLRKVDELRDQLCKSYALKLETRNEKFLKGGTHQQEQERPIYSNYAQRRQKDPNCYRRNDPWHFSGAYPPSNSLPFQGRDSSQIPMASDCRCGYTGLQCCHEQFQYPLQRPPVAKVCYSEQLCQIHPGYMCYHPCASGPVNNSNFAPRVCNSQPLPHSQRHMDHKVEKQNLYPHRDRRNHIKRHCLPVAGGAPIIVCYSCKILLQLPADFILSSNRCTKLRCSSCSEVLIFQLQSGRSVPFRPNPPTVPPPSEVDSHSNSTSRRSLDFFVSKENNRNRDESSVLDETSRANSRRILLEKRLHGKEVQRTSGSPLHSLMGYPSPRRLLIKRSSDIDQER